MLLIRSGAPHGLGLAAVVCALGTCAVLATPASAALECGDTITTDKTLHENLECPAGTNGVTFGAAGIRLDLNGHRISGPSEPGYSGVVIPGTSDAKVINGKIRGFENGIGAALVSGLTLRKLDVRNSEEESLALTTVGNAVVTDSRMRSPGNGVTILVNGTSTLVEVSENELQGGEILLEQGQDLRVIANDFTELLAGGVDVEDVTGVVIRRNSIIDPGISAAIAVRFETEDARIGRNVVRGGNSTGIAVLVGADQTRVSHNDVRNTDGAGILLGPMLTDTVIRKNVVKRAGLESPGIDGINVQDDDALIEQNIANRNGDYGIESASANGSGNIANNNGNPAECTPASLCT